MRPQKPGPTVGQSEGQSERVYFRFKCNDPNGLSHDLTNIQNLESYRWTISHPLRRKTSRCTVWENNAATTLHIQFSRDSRNRQPTGSCKSYSFGSTGAL